MIPIKYSLVANYDPILNFAIIQYMEKTFSTVLAGTLVFAFGKIIESLCVGPYISYKKVVGEITYQLVFYAQFFSSKSMKKETYKEVSEKFRISAARLQTYYNAIDWMASLFLPSRDSVNKATASLIGLANGTPPGGHDDIMDNLKRVELIRKNLKIEYYES